MISQHAFAVIALTTLCASVAAQPSARLTQSDKEAIQALTASYLSALAACDADAYANLFAPQIGYFASGFRGQMTGYDQLVALVESERHCIAPAGSAAAQRRSGDVPTVAITVTDAGVFGAADLGAAQYQDEYVSTAQGWRFASRWVITAEEIQAGLDARETQAISALSSQALGENRVADGFGGERLLNAGVTISVADGRVSGRVYLADGSYYDDVYERLGPQRWRIASRTHVPAATD